MSSHVSKYMYVLRFVEILSEQGKCHVYALLSEFHGLKLPLNLIKVHLEPVETFPRSHELFNSPAAPLVLTGRQKGLPCSLVNLPSGLGVCKQQLDGQKSPSSEELHFRSSLLSWMDPASISLL